MARTSVQFSSIYQSCLTLCTPMDCSMPDLPVHHQLPEFTQTHVHWDGDAIQPSHPLSSPSPPAFNLSQHQYLFNKVFSNKSALHIRWPMYWSFSFISSSNEYSGLISFRWTDWITLCYKGFSRVFYHTISSKARTHLTINGSFPDICCSFQCEWVSEVT